jgi:hypothetical protein
MMLENALRAQSANYQARTNAGAARMKNGGMGSVHARWGTRQTRACACSVAQAAVSARSNVTPLPSQYLIENDNAYENLLCKGCLQTYY